MTKIPVTAKKHLGQNFLQNKNILDNIIASDDLSQKDILEIGPGPWDLTERILSKNPRSLTVIEIDPDMITLLEKRFPSQNIHIYQNDVLKIDISCNTNKTNEHAISMPHEYIVYGNIPYYITSPILMHFLYDITHAPTAMHITMQKEVAERILARDKKHSVLSLACQLVASISKVCDIHPNNFVPVPKVWSTCLRFEFRLWQDRQQLKKILTIIKYGFAQKRKKLFSNLVHAWYEAGLVQKIFLSLWFSENIRAEDLDLEEWKLLSQKMLWL